MDKIPVIDISALVGQTAETTSVAEQIGDACRQRGFFYVVGHGVNQSLFERMEARSATSSLRRISIRKSKYEWNWAVQRGAATLLSETN